MINKKELKDIVILFSVIGAILFFHPIPHEIGHMAASSALGYEGRFYHAPGDLLPSGYELNTDSWGDIPSPKLFIIGVAGGVAAALVLVGLYFAIKSALVREWFRFFIIFFSIYALAEGIMATVYHISLIPTWVLGAAWFIAVADLHFNSKKIEGIGGYR